MTLKRSIWARQSRQSLMFLRITGIRMKDFRSVESASVQLKPLTLIVGGNSAGKSSLLTVIRLFAQAQHQDENSLLVGLNGSDVEMGRFEDVLRRGSQDDANRIGRQYVKGGRIGVGFTIEGKLGRSRGRTSQQPLSENVRMDVNIGMVESVELGDGAADIVHFSVDAFIDGRKVESMTLRTLVGPFDYQVDTPLLSDELLEMNDESLQYEDSGIEVASDAFLSDLHVPSGRVARNLTRNADVSSDLSFRMMLESKWMLADESDELEEEYRQTEISLIDGEVTIYQDSDDEFEVVPIEAWRALGGIPMAFGSSRNPTDVLEGWLTQFDFSTPGPRTDKMRQWIDADKNRNLVDLSAPLEDRILEAIDSIGANRFAANGSELLYRRLRSLFAEDLQKGVETILQDWDHFSGKLQNMDPAWGARRIFPADFSLIAGWLPSVARLFGESIQYLGPLRQGPKNLYTYGERGGVDEIGNDARYFAFYLSRHHATIVDSLLPKGSAVRMSLVEAISRWASRLNVAQGVRVTEVPGAGRRVDVRLAGLDRDIAWDKVGVGVSQVLPVLLKVLSSPKESVVLLEQPELHLHPDAQAELAEFLLRAALTGRQIIIETHSDLFVTRLRRLIAEASLDGHFPLGESISFVFAERSQETGITSMQNVATDPLGGFLEWPVGFADQTSLEAEKLIRARLAVSEQKKLS